MEFGVMLRVNRCGLAVERVHLTNFGSQTRLLAPDFNFKTPDFLAHGVAVQKKFLLRNFVRLIQRKPQYVGVDPAVTSSMRTY
jgi:hypothetical protein